MITKTNLATDRAVEDKLGLKLPFIISKLFNNSVPVLAAPSVNGYENMSFGSGSNLVLPTTITIKNKLFKVHSAVLYGVGKTPLIRVLRKTESDDNLISPIGNNWIIPKAELQDVDTVHLVGALPHVAENSVLTNGKFLGYYLRTLRVYSNSYTGVSIKRILSDKLNIRVMRTAHYNRIVLNTDILADGYSISPIVFMHPTMQKLCHAGDSNSFIFTYIKPNNAFVLQQPYIDASGKPTRKMRTIISFYSKEQALTWLRINITNLSSSDIYDVFKWLTDHN